MFSLYDSLLYWSVLCTLLILTCMHTQKRRKAYHVASCFALPHAALRTGGSGQAEFLTKLFFYHNSYRTLICFWNRSSTNYPERAPIMTVLNCLLLCSSRVINRSIEDRAKMLCLTCEKGVSYVCCWLETSLFLANLFCWRDVMGMRNEKTVRRGLPLSSAERSKNGRWLICLKSGTAEIVL